jgi:hypothetical protein
MFNTLWNPALSAFFVLVLLQTSFSIIYKIAAFDKDLYTFSQPGLLTLTELTKLCLSIIFLKLSSSVRITSYFHLEPRKWCRARR